MRACVRACVRARARVCVHSRLLQDYADTQAHLNIPTLQFGGTIGRVNSGNFGHQVNSDRHLQTVETQMRLLHMSRLIWIFTVCLVKKMYFNNQNMNQTR